jgi:hypothetical protein
VYTTDAFDTWKRSASVSNKKPTIKKSNASSTQPRIPEPTANYQPFAARSILVSIPDTNAMYKLAVSATAYGRPGMNSTVFQVKRLYPSLDQA